jgi:hypothetical protein
MNTFVREAERGSFQHGKVVLEMAGVYTEKVKVEDVTPLADKLALARARAAEAVKHGETAD